MIKVLFVCLGNICRSPSAEAVMKSLINDKNLSDKYFIDSAGTYGGHAGTPADSRMMSHAIKRGYNLTSISRKINENDFYEFDYILAMDNENFSRLTSLKPTDSPSRLIKMVDFLTTIESSVVPDPYYGGSDGFEVVLDILEESCENLLQQIEDNNI